MGDMGIYLSKNGKYEKSCMGKDALASLANNIRLSEA